MVEIVIRACRYQLDDQGVEHECLAKRNKGLVLRARLVDATRARDRSHVVALLGLARQEGVAEHVE